MDHVLRHRTARGYADNQWDLSDDGLLLVSIRVASAPTVCLPIIVKSVRARRRRNGEFGCWRLDSSGENWRVEHGVYDAWLDPPHPLLPALSLVLLNAPADVSQRLGEIVG